MVSSQKCYSIWIFHFIAEQEFKGLYWVVSSVNEISDEDVATILDLTT